MNRHWKLGDFILTELDDGKIYWSKFTEKHLHHWVWYFKPVQEAISGRTRIEGNTLILLSSKLQFLGNISDYEDCKKWTDSLSTWDKTKYYVDLNMSGIPVLHCKTSEMVKGDLANQIRKRLGSLK